MLNHLTFDSLSFEFRLFIKLREFLQVPMAATALQLQTTNDKVHDLTPKVQHIPYHVPTRKNVRFNDCDVTIH